MDFKYFGNQDKPVILFLHGGGLSWWSWKPQIEALQHDFFVVAAIIEGHGEAAGTPFISIQESAKNLIENINKQYGGRIFAICGLSIGAQILVEVLAQKPDITEYAVIESALVIPMKTTVALTVPLYELFYGLIKKRWVAKLQGKALNIPDDLFESYFEDSSRMTKNSLVNITRSNGNFPIPVGLNKTKAKALILVGEKELGIMKNSAKILHETIPKSRLVINEKSGHGEISLKASGKYLSLLFELFHS
ncbi:alpha/beta fold hydrolase [Acetobacterium bakii]|uniref:Alpha/beta hydrolase n=1 Tax=Acetobacterium bakii TaxID=52689 RepID=A0A0L6TZ52_9FIRM|nr:alpha/beta hydrolase [Acetobacterium bakii]KNZ41554.1 alpha/beta hydrolase [Acetobacterium bakii]